MLKNDPFGQACLAYLKGIRGLEITVKSNHCEDDVIPVDYLFRNHEKMPILEQTALGLCKGDILDIGAGAGCHSKWLSENGFKVLSIDQSLGAIEALKQQQLRTFKTDFFSFSTDTKFDTLLALMNGTGISGTLEKFPQFLEKCKNLLTNTGQLLIDSSDIIYLFENEKELQKHAKGKYYGEVKYQMFFDEDESNWFDWIYLSYGKLNNLCKHSNMNCELIIEGEHYDYLARITVT